MPYLCKDIYNLKGDFLYARKGTQVDILHDGERAVVVVDEDGNRFPMEAQYLSDEPVEKDEVVKVEPVKKGKSKTIQQRLL